MKDIYCLQIFNITNFFTLFELQKYSEALFIIPYAIWTEVIRNPNLTPQARLDMLTLAFDIFLNFKLKIPDLMEGVTQKSANSILFFSSGTSLISILNSILALAREIIFNSSDLAIDRLGTHCLECFFGRTRLLKLLQKR